MIAQSRFGAVRVLTAVVGICSIAWSIYSSTAYPAESLLRDSAERILSGEIFSPEQLNGLRRKLDAISKVSPGALALSNAVVLRSRLLESELKSRNSDLASSALVDLEAAVAAALAEVPTNSFLWLAYYWVHELRVDMLDDRVGYLRMSYWLAPNEAWVAIRRNPLALATFSSLPAELQERALSEFAGAVRSRLFVEAADILVGPGWPIHEKLLGRLAEIKESDRRNFAEELKSRGLDGAGVPGLENQPSRPF